MKLTIKHYYDFGYHSKGLEGTLLNPVSWDHLRVGQNDSDNVFALPPDRSMWQERCLANQALHQRAEAIVHILKGNYHRVHSYGVGCACLEFLLKVKNSDLFLQCSDFTPLTVNRLKIIFLEADEITQFDMFKDNWKNTENDCIHLLYRVDTEFDDAQWSTVFEKMKKAGIKNILFIPDGFLNLRRMMTEKIKYIADQWRGKKMTFAGYLRTEDQFKFLFNKFYQIKSVENIGDLKGFLLELRGDV